MNVPAVFNAAVSLTAMLLLAACASPPPTESHDGLVLVPDAPMGTLYRRPGADLATYDAYGLEGCSVAFKKNWLRDQNSSRMDLSNRVTQKDVDRIKDSLAELCEEQFRAALEQPPAYQLVDDFDNGEAVLVLRPQIINLDIAAPDVFAPGMTRTYTTQAGEMTLVLEGLDGTTGQILFRVVDRQRSMDSFRLQWTNSVTNQADATRMLKRWASQLRQGLDRAAAASGTSP